MIRNQWYAILPSHQVRRNRLTAIRRLGLDLVLFRDEQGEIGCVTDRCSHRGAALSAGRVESGCVRCPFHGIRFDTGGRCAFVPALGKSSTEDLSRFNVQSHPVREEHGVVYLWYGDEAMVAGEPPFFDDQIDESYASAGMEDVWGAHYSRVIENQLDVIHVPIVHHNTIGRGNRTLINGPKVIEDPPIIQTSANNELDHGQKPKPAEECVIKDTNLTFIFPNIWLNRISDTIKLVACFAPVDDESTVLYLVFYNKLTPFRPVNKAISTFGNIFNFIVERQDRRVVVTQRPKASSLQGGENLLRGDAPVIAYRRMRKALKEAAGQTE